MRPKQPLYLHHYVRLVGWGKWEHYFECDEFQNRGTIHTHGFTYVEKSIPELICLNTIRADVPDPTNEPILYDLVTKISDSSLSSQ